MVLDEKQIDRKKIEKQHGIYILTPYSSPKTKADKDVKVKIGSSTNLYKRSNDYGTCLPASYWIYSFIIVKETDRGYLARKLEKEIHLELKKYQYKHTQYEPRADPEWFQLKKGKLKSIINQVLKNNREIVKEVYNVHPYYFKLEA